MGEWYAVAAMRPARSTLGAILVIAVGLLPLVPIVAFGPPGLGHDLDFHHAHVRAFADAVADGAGYPSWAAPMNGGYGAPSFRFYPPLGWALAAACGALTGDTMSGFFVAAAIASVLGAVALYRLLRRDVGRVPALLGVAIFVVSPYAILDLYYRFAWAEYCAIQWMPAIVLALRRQLERPGGWRAVALAACTCGLVATHVVTALTFGPLLVLAVGYEALRRRSWRTVVAGALPAAFGLAAAAPLLLPIVIEGGLVHLEHITASRHGQVGRNFLFRDEQTLGFTASYFKNTVEFAALAQLAVVVGAAAALALRRRLTGGVVALVVAAIAHLYLSTAWSAPVWRWFPWLGTVQFPWRLLGALGFLCAWLVAAAAGGTPIPGRSRRLARACALGVPLVAVVAFSLDAVRTSLAPDEPWLINVREQPRPTSVVTREYLPKAVEVGNLMELVDYDPERRTVAIAGEARFEWIVWTGQHRRARVRVDSDVAHVVLPIFRYAGWKATIDGAPVAIDGPNAMALIEVAVPRGEHVLDVRDTGGTARRVGWWIALAAIGVGGLLAFARRGPGRVSPAARPFFVGRARLVPLGVAAALVAAPIVAPLPPIRPPIVVVTGAALRADHAAFNGYARPTTPNLSFLCGHEGIVIRRAYTPVPDPAAAADELFAASGLVQRFRDAGYSIGAFLGTDLLASRPALAAALPGARVPESGRRTPDAEVIARAMLWLRAEGDRPTFLWVHLADSGGPWLAGDDGFVSPPGPRVAPDAIPESLRIRDAAGRIVTDLSIYRDRYDDVLVRTDRTLGRFLTDLYRTHRYDAAAVAVVGLAGIDLGDGPTPLVQGASLHESQTAVMCMLKLPGARHGGEAIFGAPVDVRWLAPTFTELLPGAAREARSLVRLLESPDERWAVEVRSPDGAVVDRVFDDVKVRWTRGADPAVLRRNVLPPWEEPWTGPLPDVATRALDGRR